MNNLRKIKVLLTVFLSFAIIASIVTMIVIVNQYSRYRGDVEGTGFVLHELVGVGTTHYDVDIDGNIYFAVDTLPLANNPSGVVVYDSLGKYKYTLYTPGVGSIGVSVQHDGEINVYHARDRTISSYNSDGLLIKKEDTAISMYMYSSLETERENEEYMYNLQEAKIVREDKNGNVEVVFSVPWWQNLHNAMSIVLPIAIALLFLLHLIPKSIRATKAQMEIRKNANGQ